MTSTADAIRASKIAAARAVKASRLAAWLEAQCPEALKQDEALTVLAGMGDEWWRQVAANAGCNKPSAESIDEVIKLLAIRRQVRAENRSPLEGLFSG